MNIFILLWMGFNHIVDDYYLQGVLASMKQKSWWENNPNTMYSKDYLAALLAHAFSWTFMMMLPIAIVRRLYLGVPFVILFLINWGIHAYVDNEKANKKSINLIQDQLIHVGQILVTFGCFICNFI